MAQNSNHKDDLRVRRTRKMLHIALIELTIQKGFESVTIRDICEHAMVNRATFYRHYIDKYALLDEYMDSIYELLDHSQGEASPDRPDEPPAGLVRLLEHLRGHADFYRVMLGPKGYPQFGERIRQYVEKRLRHALPENAIPSAPGLPPPEMLLRSISSASLGAIVWWLEKDLPVSPEQMALWGTQISCLLMGQISSGQ
ncbi:MAG: TetR/AcrR family transcriptional regulator [Chloroflexi bacterium]|nr:TetR/AcrR family transcriptional regulator [Chloroflexota bacterium]